MNTDTQQDIWPDARGRFGEFGGRFVAETLMPLILELESAWDEVRNDPDFTAQMDAYMRDYVGRQIGRAHV